MDDHPKGALTFMLLSLVGHGADVHFTPMCAMLLTASAGERHCTHAWAVSHGHSDQVLKGGTTKAGQ
jgi:hypothetical protein